MQGELEQVHAPFHPWIALYLYVPVLQLLVFHEPQLQLEQPLHVALLVQVRVLVPQPESQVADSTLLVSPLQYGWEQPLEYDQPPQEPPPQVAEQERVKVAALPPHE